MTAISSRDRLQAQSIWEMSVYNNDAAWMRSPAGNCRGFTAIIVVLDVEMGKLRGDWNGQGKGRPGSPTRARARVREPRNSSFRR